MGKPKICIGENKAQISFAVTAKLISAFVFATRIVQFLFYLNPKFQASSSFLCLYRSVCVGPVRKPHCWFSHEAAHISVVGRFSYFLAFPQYFTSVVAVQSELSKIAYKKAAEILESVYKSYNVEGHLFTMKTGTCNAVYDT